MYPRNRGAGTPSLLTPELHAALIEDRRGTLPDRDVALKNGVSRSSLIAWLAYGLKENAVEPYLSFAEDWERAKISRKESLLKVITDAAETFKGSESPAARGQYKAATWLLERMAPMQWGPSALLKGFQAGDIDLNNLVEETEAQANNLDSLFISPPEQVLAAMIRCAPEIRALLDEHVPVPALAAAKT
jgi:hypothetical protein